MKDDAKGRSRGVQLAIDRIDRFLEEGHVWVALAGAGALLLLQIPGVDGLIEKLGLENSLQLRIAVAVILLASILLELRQLRRSVTPAISARQHYPDPDEMYDALKGKARAITDPEHREIKVLGLTLYSAWPVLEFFLERPEITDWTVKLATLSKDATAPREWVPVGWPQESDTTIRQIHEFEKGHGAEHNHKIEIFEYGFTPVVHGFRLGNGDVFLSTLRWRPDGRLGKHRFPYDYVSAQDDSAAADAMRALFKSWFDRAICSDAGASTTANPDTDPPKELPE